MKISLNQLLSTSICSYWWPLNLTDYFCESAREDLRECSDRNYGAKDNFITVETGDKTERVNINDIDYDREYVAWYEKLECDNLVWRFDDERFTKALEKYWIKKIWYSIWKPQFYNFGQDSLDLEFETENIDWKAKYPELVELVKYYIDNVRVKSYDGYQSFEPDNIDNVTMDDYCYIRAVLKHENLLDELKSDLEMWIEDTVIYAYELINWIIYEYNGKKYHLDYENKKLELIE